MVPTIVCKYFHREENVADLGPSDLSHYSDVNYSEEDAIIIVYHIMGTHLLQ